MRKLRGSRSFKSVAPTATVTAEEKPKHGFVYLQDYPSLALYFAKLVDTVSAEANYKPTETELSVDGLQARLMELQQLNDLVTKAEIELTRVRRERNALFYKGEGNLFATAVAAKHYVRGAFGFSSNQRAEVSKVRFNKPIM